MKKYNYCLLFIVFILKASFALADLKTTIQETTDEYLATHFLNATFMFTEKDDVLLVGAKGVFSLDGEQLKPDQIMPIASGTKPMTAAGILKLQDRKLLNVKDKVAKYLGKDSGIWKDGKVPTWAEKVSLHNLLTHTSGIIEYFMGKGMKIDITMPHCNINKEIACFAASNSLKFTPGEKFEYSNTNFVLLGLIIEKVSGKPLAEFFHEEFFQPLEMKDTHLALLEEAIKLQTDPASTPYPFRYFVIPTGGQPQFSPAKVDFIAVPYADGGVISTTEDMTKWHKALHEGKILSNKSYKLMITKHYPMQEKSGRKSYAGYGMIISELENGNVVYHHSGNAIGIRSESGYVPSKELYFAILSNVMMHIPEDMKGKIDLNNPANQLDILYFRETILKAVEGMN